MHRISFLILVAALITSLPVSPSFAHQPVMDMAPRWQKGFGGQVRYETYSSDKVLEGSKKIDNPLGRENFVHKTWLEGVYTFKREVRVTLKVPFVYQERISAINGVAPHQLAKTLT